MIRRSSSLRATIWGLALAGILVATPAPIGGPAVAHPGVFNSVRMDATSNRIVAQVWPGDDDPFDPAPDARHYPLSLRSTSAETGAITNRTLAQVVPGSDDPFDPEPDARHYPLSLRSTSAGSAATSDRTFAQAWPGDDGSFDPAPDARHYPLSLG